jgi:hypothetical protein
MSYIIVKQDQTIFDMALQIYGDISFVYKLIQDNPTLINIHPNNLVGFNLFYDGEIKTNTRYFTKNNISITTMSPVIDTGETFNDSFDDSFN